ncbi:MAG: hypothetical protein V8R63_02495 [Thomasclavelia ramosa]
MNLWLEICLEPLLENEIKVDIFVSNPPYIPQEQEIEAMVKDNEPHVALFGGNDGLYFYRKILKGVEPLLQERALLAFEMGFDERELIKAVTARSISLTIPMKSLRILMEKIVCYLFIVILNKHRKVLLLYNEIKVGYDDH